MDLNYAIEQFDAAETTLRRLEDVWARMRTLVPDGITFAGDSDDGVVHEDLRRAYRDLVAGLPAIEGFRITAQPAPLDAIAQDRFDARDIGILDAIASVEAGIAAPGEEIREYRFRFNRARRKVARDRMLELIAEVETLLPTITSKVERNSDPAPEAEWAQLGKAFSEVERLAGSSTPRTGRWGELRRHLMWAQGVDALDIAEHDWPSVLNDIEQSLYAETEPIPVAVDDLGVLAESHPAGGVTTALSWGELNAEQFERLIFNLISNTPGYQNPKWLTKLTAPDGGRDLTVERVHDDPLSGPRTQRVIISCKHWLSRSIDPEEIQKALSRVKLAEPPAVDAVVIATSGRFTGDAQRVIEKHNADRERPEINPWPENHLELLLARRPDLVPPALRRTLG